MAEFCKCGSIIIKDKCTNKNCNLKTEKGTTSVSATSKKAASSKSTSEKKPKATGGARRSSKCITYSIDKLAEKDERYRDFAHDTDSNSKESNDDYFEDGRDDRDDRDDGDDRDDRDGRADRDDNGDD